MDCLFTTLGPLTRDQLGMILPHEHVFVDLRTPDQPGYALAEAADVIALMAAADRADQAAGRHRAGRMHHHWRRPPRRY